MAITQENRRFTVTTPLQKDTLVLRRMTGSEQLGRLFSFDLELHSEDINIKHEDLLGENITVAIELPNQQVRHINGIVSQITMDGCSDRHVVYRATVRPWLWLLTRTNNCRIFQEKTVPDILKEVFGGHGFSDFEDRLTGSYRTWEYCVQYRETDFNFLSRLMEQEGIYYFFSHEDGKHTLVLADAPSAHQAIPGYETVPYFPPDSHQRRKRDHLQSWSASKQIQPGAYALNDYDFKAPKKSLSVVSEIPREHSSSEFEVFDYPGEYTKPSDGDTYAKARIQELQAQHEMLQGEGDAAGLSTGSVFTLSEFPRDDQNRKYLIIGAHYSMSSSGLEGGQAGELENLSVSIRAMDAEQAFRTPRKSIKPVVQGPQTAVIVGAAGEEIYVDEYGRVKVQFHWDRYGESDENSSCWIRVSQVWAGKNWGGIFTPRIGQEVIVDFLEGDPDLPIITGRVYNNDQMPPYDLPVNKTQSGIKSNSSVGGEGSNEIRFEDKKGEEQFFIHGEKDQEIIIKNDCTESIGNDRLLSVANLEKKTVGATLGLTVEGDVTETFNANHTMAVTGDSKITGTNITIEASSSITLKVGGSSITIESGGITVSSGGSVDVKAGGVATIKGSIVNIN
ncbi:MAG: type VI secretion system tip protein VgrG [Gammaproteobacteria bacterium]|nr:MAG: type VI secretion system tip protein VgrG [Gammaproteobacteria bacterium]